MSIRDKYKCISRIDHDEKSTHGWEVRIRRRGKKINKFFSDSKFGKDPHKAFLAAMEARDELLKEYPKLNSIERAQRQRKNNKSGIPGVSKTVNIKKYKGKKYKYTFWQAYWSKSDGQTQSVRFSVQKYGEEIAKQKAVEARNNALELIKKGEL